MNAFLLKLVYMSIRSSKNKNIKTMILNSRIVVKSTFSAIHQLDVILKVRNPPIRRYTQDGTKLMCNKTHDHSKKSLVIYITKTYKKTCQNSENSFGIVFKTCNSFFFLKKTTLQHKNYYT